MFSFIKGLRGETVHLIADSCQELNKLSLSVQEMFDDDVMHINEKRGKLLKTMSCKSALSYTLHIYDSNLLNVIRCYNVHVPLQFVCNLNHVS
jgi:hypothetical protein